MIQHKKLLVILLIISVSFNVFFMLGYVHSRHAVKMLKTPEGRIEFISKKLKLNKEQELAYAQFAGQISMERLSQKNQHDTEIKIFWQEALKDNPDPQKIKAGLELHLALNQKLQPLKTDVLLRFLKILTPEQKRLYIAILRKLGSRP